MCREKEILKQIRFRFWEQIFGWYLTPRIHEAKMLRIQKIQPLCTSCSNLKLNPSKNQLIISWSLIFWEQFFVWLLFGQILSDYSLILFRWPSMQRYTMPDSHRYLFFRILQLKNKVFYFCQNCFIIHWKCRLYEMGRISTWITFIWNGKDFNMNYVYMK